MIRADLITPQMLMENFKGITKTQVLQIFHLAELRAICDTVKGHKTLFGEVAASMLLCLDETRDGVRIMQSQEFVSNREAKIWLDDQQEVLAAPSNVYDLGPGEYVVLRGLEVQAGESLGSEAIGMLEAGQHVNVVQTLDNDEGPTLKRLRGKIEIESGVGWISLNDPLSGLFWAELYVPPLKDEWLPGLYDVIHDGSAVKQDVGMASPTLGSLSKGATVKIVEVIKNYYDIDMQCTRTRGRLAGTGGWMSLLDQDLKYRFAQRCEEQLRCGQYEAIIDNTAILSEPPETNIVCNYLKKGGQVEVAEIRSVVNESTGEERVMGRIQSGGWVLLQNKTTGQTFLEISANDPAIKLSGIQPVKAETAMPSFAPVWVKDGLLAHLQRQQRNMLDLSAKFQNMTQELENKGMQVTKQTPEIPTPMPDAPDFDVMLQPPRNGLKDGQAPLRRTEAVVNTPRGTRPPTSQSVKTRLAHFRLEI